MGPSCRHDRGLVRDRRDNADALPWRSILACSAACHAGFAAKAFRLRDDLINESLEEIQKLDLKDLPIKWEGEPDDEAA